MENALAPLFTILQASLGGWGLLLLIPLFWAPLMRWRKEANLRRRMAWLLALPLPWMLLAYWTAFHWHGAAQPAPISRASEGLAIGTLVVDLGLGLASVILNRGARWVFAGWSLVNAWFAAIGALLCVMATSGNWI